MRRFLIPILVLAVVAAATAAFLFWRSWQPNPLAGMPPVVHRENIYSETGAGQFSAAVAGALPRVYVPDVKGGDVYVIDPAQLRVIGRFPAGRHPQHVVPSYDLKTLWVAGSAAPGRGPGFVMPIDPRSGEPGSIIKVPDAYNLYFTPDGRAAVIVAEEDKRLDFRDPHTMQFLGTVRTPECRGINHADFAIHGRTAIFSCEFGGNLIKLDVRERHVTATLPLPQPSMPQDVRLSPDGKLFYVADMMRDGVFLIDGERFAIAGFIHTGIGTHGLVVSRDGTKLYVSNRGSHVVEDRPGGPGSVSVIDFATRRVVKTWPIPGGGSPDMGSVSADGRYLWMSGRFDNVIYRIDTRSGAVVKIPVGREPHGLAIWPLPGRYSLGHTGIMR
ncbi:MAG TPA: YncE family protein [Rhizomicrobium sp.]